MCYKSQTENITKIIYQQMLNTVTSYYNVYHKYV